MSAVSYMEPRGTHQPPLNRKIDETISDALESLGDLSNWELAPQRWESVREIPDRIAEASEEADLPGLRHAIADQGRPETSTRQPGAGDAGRPAS
jgi:hypothetical protein